MARSFSGRRLRGARLAADVRPETLAVLVGRSVHSIDAYELGHVVPPLSVLLRLTSALGCAVDDLLDEEVECVA